MAAGIRVGHLMRLRVKDVKIDSLQIYLRRPKGRNDYLTLMAKSVVESLEEHLTQVRQAHDKAMRDGVGGHAIALRVGAEIPGWEQRRGKWQFLFPSRRPSRDPETGSVWRHHENKSTIETVQGGGASGGDHPKLRLSHSSPFLCHAFANHRA